MIRITVTSDNVGEGVSTIARYLEKHIRDIFDNVTLIDTDVIEMSKEVERSNLHTLIYKQPQFEIVAHSMGHAVIEEKE